MWIRESQGDHVTLDDGVVSTFELLFYIFGKIHRNTEKGDSLCNRSWPRQPPKCPSIDRSCVLEETDWRTNVYMSRLKTFVKMKTILLFGNLF